MSLLDTGTATAQLREARDFLLAHREDYDTAYRDFRWPALDDVQLGARLVRRAGRRGRRAAGAVDRRGGRQRGRRYVRRAVRALQPGRQLAARAGRRARRPHDPDARQPGRAVGDDARGDEARRGDHPGDDAARAAPTCVDRVERGDVRHVVVRARRRARSSTTCPATTRASRSASRSTGWLRLRRRRRRRRRRSRPTARPRRRDPLLLYFTSGTTAQPKLVEHTHVVLSGRAPVDDVLDRPAAGRRAPQHLLARAGPSTRGATSSRRGSPRRRVMRLQLRALRRAGAARPDGPLRGDARSARRRPCGGC